MKLKDGFIVKQVAGETVVFPGQASANLDMMIALNDTARFLWERLTVGAETQELVDALLAEYEVDETTAAEAVDTFINTLKEHDFLA